MATTTTHTLPSPFSHHTPHEINLITQGAEALIYRTHFLTPATPIALKFRPKKSYRHPALDARLTKGRILAEARVMNRLRKEGVGVPGVVGMSWEEGWLGVEWVEGGTVRGVLDWYFRLKEVEEKEKSGREGQEEKGGDKVEEKEEGEEKDERVLGLMRRIGRAVGRMHEVGVTHGDLTTSNLMVELPTPHSSTSSSTSIPTIDDEVPLPPPPASETILETQDSSSQPQSLHAPQIFPPSILSGSIVLIDFGLSVQTVQDEDRAVDLYVLERAFSSTHPQAGSLFTEVLDAYGKSYKGAGIVLKRLEDVRLRGRKKSMIG